MPADRERSVFLNVPYDPPYEPRFVALVGTLIALGRIPRSVIEISERGQGRLLRIFEVLEGCRVSIHDLCRVGRPARFNMPFEAGLAFGVQRYRAADHEVIVLDTVAFRPQRTLSDLPNIDHSIIYPRGSAARLASGLLDALGTTGTEPRAGEVEQLRRRLRSAVPEIKRRLGVADLYGRRAFTALVEAASTAAIDLGILPLVGAR